MKDILTQYTNYNLWANEKLLGFIESAIANDPSILDKELTSSFSTIRKTVYHIYYAELVWYKRLRGESLVFNKEELENIALNGSPLPGGVPDGLGGSESNPLSGGVPDGRGGFSEFKKLFLSQSQDFIDYVKTLDDEKLSSGFEYKSTEGTAYENKIWESIHHCMNHSTFHRGQLITMLRNVGYTDLSSTDFITYIREGK
jgi:uncharacterized damage-inducible protein DinB